MANEKLETVVEQPATTKTATKKATATTTTATAEKEKVEIDYKKENEELKTRLDEQANQITQLLEAFKLQSLNNNNQQPIIIQQPQVKKYKVINLTSDHNEMGLKSDRERYSLKGYGDYKYFDEEEFRAIVRHQAKFFRMGFLTTDGDGAEVLEQRGIKPTNRYLSKTELDNLDKLGEKELGDLFNTLHVTQQERLVETFVDGIIAGEKDGYKDIKKISALNKLYKTNNRLKKQLQDLVIKVSEI